MTPILADVHAAIMMSIAKPIIFLIVLGMWAWVVSHLDKDAEYFYLSRRLWNGIEMGAGAAAFGLWLLMPGAAGFYIGLVLALGICGGAIYGYAAFRNMHVPAEARWSLSLNSFRQRIDAVQHAQAQQRASVRLLEADGSPNEVPSGADNPEAAAHEALESVMEFALPRGGERIDVAVAAQQAAMVVWVDGVKYPQPIEQKTALALIDYLKKYADLDTSDRRRRQDGDLRLSAGIGDETQKHTLRVSTHGSTRELALSLRIDPDAWAALGLIKLGLLDAQRQQLETIIKQDNGVVLITSPRGQGLTTTLYGILKEHDPYTQSVATLEESVAFELEGVQHNVIEAGADGQQVASKVGALVRQGPDVLMLSRLSDAAVAKTMAESGGEARVYAGMRQNDTFSALSTWVKAIGDVRLAADSLVAVTAQRLVRKLCPTCRVAYKPDPDALRKLNLPAERVGNLYKHSGQVLVKNKAQPCPDCLGLAYRGRTGVFEIMVLDDAARKLIKANQLDQLRIYLRKRKMVWLQEAALTKVVEGVTSISEITRALSGKD